MMIMMSRMILLECTILGLLFGTTSAFQTLSLGGLKHKATIPLSTTGQRQEIALKSSEDDVDSSTSAEPSLEDELETKKSNLMRMCDQKRSLEDMLNVVSDLESTAELIGIGQSSAFSGLLSGEWECIYASEDLTRSSPFFWAFRKAVPDNSDQIFGITDAIPAPIKDVGPAIQTIEFDTDTQTGKFVSRVKVATLGGAATSMMTTRASIVGVDGVDGIKLKIETTKPEDSTMIKTVFGPLGDLINENAPPFPSGEALEKVAPGSSEVTVLSTYCDEELRISRNADRPNDDLYIFKRKNFVTTEFV